MVLHGSVILLLACGGEPEEEDLPAVAAAADAGDDKVGVVGEVLTFAGAADGAATWDFGDGNDASGANARHRYSKPGHYTAWLEVEADDGTLASDSVEVTITWPHAETTQSSSSIAAVEDRLYVVVPDFDVVAVVEGLEVVEWLATCGSPRSVSASSERVVVACEDDTVDFFEDHALVGRAGTGWGSRPFGVLVDGNQATVTLQGTGEVATVGVDGVISRQAVAPDLRGLAQVGDELLVSRYRSEADGATWARGAGGTWQFGVIPPDPGPDSDTDARGTPSYLQRVVVRPDGREAVLVGLKANLERGLVRDGITPTFETVARGTVRRIDLIDGTELEPPQFDNRDLMSAAAYSPLGDWLYVAAHGAETVDVLDAVTMQRGGGFQSVGHGLDGLYATDEALYVVAALSRELVVFDLTVPSSDQVELARIDLRPGGREVLDADVLLGKQIFHSSADPRMGTDAYLSCGSCHLEGENDGFTWDFTDRGEGLRNTHTLRGLVEGPLHWTGNFDEVQDFEHDIRGPNQGSGFLDDADWDATNTTLGAEKAGLSEELDALAAYVLSLPVPRSPFREADGSLSQEAEDGAKVFDEAGCDDCHAGPDYTDAGWVDRDAGIPILHDVGTITVDSGQRLGMGPITGLDTPSLRGVWATPPYLHDGSAASLREVLVDRNPADQHGVTSDLTETELGALMQFLLELE